MRLYIVRHGEAEGQAQTRTDQARALTARGREEVGQLWPALAERGVALSRIINSSYLRAEQTADIIAARFPQAVREQWDSITPQGKPAQIVDELAKLDTVEGLALVSHMPIVDLLCGLLTDGQRHSFPVGSVACIDVEVLAAGGGRLLWLRSPADIR